MRHAVAPTVHYRVELFSLRNQQAALTEWVNDFLACLEPWQQELAECQLSTCPDGRQEGLYHTVMVVYPITDATDPRDQAPPTPSGGAGG